MTKLLSIALLLVLPDLGHALPGSTVDPSALASPMPRTIQAQAADVFNPRNFGAVGDGKSHTASEALGVRTLADLASYTVNGVAPYTWVKGAPYGSLYANLPASQVSPPGTTIVYIGTRHKSGVVLPTSSATAAGLDVLNVSAPMVPPGTAVTGSSCIPSGTVAGQDFGSQMAIIAGASGLPVKTTCPIAAGTVLSFGVSSDGFLVRSAPLAGRSTASVAGETSFGIQPGDVVPGSVPQRAALVGGGAGSPATIDPVCAADFKSGMLTLCARAAKAQAASRQFSLLLGWAIYMTDTAGIEAGMEVSGTGILGSVYVDDVNRSTNLIRLSRPVGNLAAGTSLLFTWPDAAKISPGITMASGPGIQIGTKVTAYDADTGAVTLSLPITAPQYPVTSSVYGSGMAPPSVRLRGTPMVFWTPWSDAQASALQMDALGIIAAEKAAESRGGGQLSIPSGKYRIDQPIIVPTYAIYAERAPVVDIVGAGKHETSLIASDMGKDRYVLSCGDSTATPELGVGVYSGKGDGGFCDGEFKAMSISTASTLPLAGVRPTISGTPVEIGGIWGGPRRRLTDIDITGFNTGIEYHADHTAYQNVTSQGNFKGLRVGWAMHQLFGDNTMINVMYGANGWCGMCVAADTFWNGTITNNSYLGFNPYDIYCESGSNTQCLQGSTFTNTNWEASSCGMIVDGNAWPGTSDQHVSRGIYNVTISQSYAAFGTTFTPAGGCAFPAYIRMAVIDGLTIDQIWPNAFPPVAGSYGIISALRTDNYSPGSGGIHLSGPGLTSIFEKYGASCVQVVGEVGGGGAFMYTHGADNVKFDIPGVFSGRFAWWNDAAMTAPRVGTVVELAPMGVTLLAAQAAGRAAEGTAPVVGSVAMAYATRKGCTAVGKAIPIATSGDNMPIAVDGPTTLGALLADPTSSQSAGVARTASSVAKANWIVQSPSSSTLVFGRRITH